MSEQPTLPPNPYEDKDLNAMRKQAEQDLGDIATLRKSEAFNRYFIRHLNLRHARYGKAFKYDEVTHERREVLRCLVNELEEIAGMMAQHEAEAQHTIERANRVRGKAPPGAPAFG